MPSAIICPNCRKPLEESGRLTCPDCSAILPSNHPTAPLAAIQSRPAPAAMSALDEFTIPQRPTGAMTLLRNDLRSDDKTKQPTGWLDNIIPKKPKEGTEVETAVNPRPIRESSKPPSPSDDSALEVKARPQPRVPASAPSPVASPARIERPTPDHGSLLSSSTRTEPSLNHQVPIIGVVTGAIFALLSTLALLQGKEGLLDTVLLVTVGVLGASILGIWQRQGAKRAFWQGFAVFGLGYLGMAFVPTFPHEAGLELPTARLIRIVHAKLVSTPEDPRDSFEIMKGLQARPEAAANPHAEPESAEANAPAPRTASFFAPGDVRQFTVVGQCSFALVFALLGSALARWFYQRSFAA
jgi:hypothetical protein